MASGESPSGLRRSWQLRAAARRCGSPSIRSFYFRTRLRRQRCCAPLHAPPTLRWPLWHLDDSGSLMPRWLLCPVFTGRQWATAGASETSPRTRRCATTQNTTTGRRPFSYNSTRASFLTRRFSTHFSELTTTSEVGARGNTRRSSLRTTMLSGQRLTLHSPSAHGRAHPSKSCSPSGKPSRIIKSGSSSASGTCSFRCSCASTMS